MKIFITNGWPKQKIDLTGEILSYWSFQEELSVINGTNYKGHRIVIPKLMGQEILENLHQSHMGISKTKARARETVWQEMQSLSDLSKTGTERTNDSKWYSHLPISNRGFRSIQLKQSRFCNSGGLLQQILGDRKIVRHKINNSSQEDEENVLKTWNTWNTTKWQWTSIPCAGV